MWKGKGKKVNRIILFLWLLGIEEVKNKHDLIPCHAKYFLVYSISFFNVQPHLLERQVNQSMLLPNSLPILCPHVSWVKWLTGLMIILARRQVLGIQHTHVQHNIVWALWESSCSVYTPTSTKQLTASNWNRIVRVGQWFWHFECCVAYTQLDGTYIVITEIYHCLLLTSGVWHLHYIKLIGMFEMLSSEFFPRMLVISFALSRYWYWQMVILKVSSIRSCLSSLHWFSKRVKPLHMCAGTSPALYLSHAHRSSGDSY